MNARKALIVDIDGTLCPIKRPDQSYAELEPYPAMIEELRHWQARHYQIVLVTSRNVKTHEGNLGLINMHTAPVLFEWLKKWNIPCDEIHYAKPWPGESGFYIDDRTIRPDEFLRYTEPELREIIERCRANLDRASE
jgi:capsule biosynthesis phosphatase